MLRLLTIVGFQVDVSTPDNPYKCSTRASTDSQGEMPFSQRTSGVAPLLPEHVAAAGGLVEPAGEDEQQVGEPVQVLARGV